MDDELTPEQAELLAQAATEFKRFWLAETAEEEQVHFAAGVGLLIQLRGNSN